MKTLFHPASERGHNQFSWLDSYHSFSFGHFYDEEKIHFGALRVLNDDKVAPGGGFGTHPHNNMEIISIPLYGKLEHKDSMGNVGVISTGDVQIMSAGTGVHHSEYNHSKEDEVHFLQIWIFPEYENTVPGYSQRFFNAEDRQNQWQTIVSPEGGEGVAIHQNSWLSRIDISPSVNTSYQIKKSGNGVYFFLIEGEAEIGEKMLKRRDAFGVWETESVDISASADAQILAIEVPML